MPLKTHLIIVSIIIASVLGVWQVARHMPKTVQLPKKQSDTRAIEVVRASWGLNCLDSFASAPQKGDAFGRTFAHNNPLKENNILVKVSEACNLRAQCVIRNDVEQLGFDPAPECPGKEIIVEYRCFSYDRPWRITIPSRESAAIDCTQQNPSLPRIGLPAADSAPADAQ